MASGGGSEDDDANAGKKKKASKDSRTTPRTQASTSLSSGLVGDVAESADQATNLVLGLAACGIAFFVLIAINVSIMSAMGGADDDDTATPPVMASGPTEPASNGALAGIGGGAPSQAAASSAATQQTFVGVAPRVYQSDTPDAAGAAATFGVTLATQQCMAAGTCTNNFFPGSQLIGPAYGLAINEWISSRYSTTLDRNIAANQAWSICFSTNDHPHQHPQEFHSRCDQYQKTVVVARNQIGFLFGGYADKSWNRCPGAQGCYGAYDTTAERDFIFGLSQTFPNGTYHPQPTMHSPHGANNHFQAGSANIWPTWGRGADLSLGMLGTPGTEAYCDQLGPGGAGHTYGAVRKETCGGALSTWGFTEIEIWYRSDEVAGR